MKTKILIILVILLFSCKSVKETKSYIRLNSNVPVKALLIKPQSDSSLIAIFVPQKFKLSEKKYKKVNFESIRFSLTGGNVFGTNKSSVFGIENDSLFFKPLKTSKYQIKNNEYEVYISYHIYLPNMESNGIFKESKQTQTLYNKQLYDINLEKISDLLKSKVPDSLKGFIHFNYTDPKTRQFDYLNIPVKF